MRSREVACADSTNTSSTGGNSNACIGAAAAGKASASRAPANQWRKRDDNGIRSVLAAGFIGHPEQVLGQSGRGFDRQQLRQFIRVQLAQPVLQGGVGLC